MRDYTWLNKQLQSNMYVYEIEDGDKGVVLANTREEAIEKLLKVYPNERDAIEGKADYFFYVFRANERNITIENDVFITVPW